MRRDHGADIEITERLATELGNGAVLATDLARRARAIGIDRAELVRSALTLPVETRGIVAAIRWSLPKQENR